MPTVLVVDDEPSICLLVSEILNEFNLHVLTAGDGYEAVRIVKQDPQAIALALLDYSLPGMDCETLIRKLRQDNQQIRVVISSGITGRLFDDPKSLGIDAMIPKPYSMRQLADLVLSLIDGRKPSTETDG